MSPVVVTVDMEKPWAEHAYSEDLAALASGCLLAPVPISIEGCFGSASIGGRGG